MIARCSAAVLLFALLVPAVAAGQVSDADRATARALAQQGQDALDAKDYATAADRFSRADAVFHAPTLLLGLARAQAGLGKLVSAHEAYARIVREGVPVGAPRPFVKAVAEAGKELARLEPRIPSVVIQVKGSTAPRVTIDGAPVPVAALGVNRPVDPGRHLVRAEADGVVPTEVVVTLAEGKSTSVTLALEPAAGPVAKPPVVASKSPAPPAAGVKPSATQRILGYTSLGVGAAGLVLGAVAGGLAVSKHAALATACPTGRCTGQSDAISSYHTVGMLSTVGFIAGGALAATGAVLLITAPRAKPVREARVGLVVGLGYAGAEGSF